MLMKIQIREWNLSHVRSQFLGLHIKIKLVVPEYITT